MAALMLLAGCTTSKAPPPPAPVTELAPSQASPPPPPEPEPKPKPVAPAPVQAAPVETKPPPAETNVVEPAPIAPERLSIRIETHPQGAMIVVDGRPVGRAPLDLEVDSANNGFFKAPVTIRARFLANYENKESFSIDEQLGPLERVPLALVFSHEGVQRILRQL